MQAKASGHLQTLRRADAVHVIVTRMSDGGSLAPDRLATAFKKTGLRAAQLKLSMHLFARLSSSGYGGESNMDSADTDAESRVWPRY